MFQNITFIIIQLIIICLSFIAFTSTIETFPWYEPLTMGAFMIIILLTPFQLIISLILGYISINEHLPKAINIVSIFNIMILLSAIIVSASNEEIFYLLAYIYPILQVPMVISLLYTILNGWEFK